MDNLGEFWSRGGLLITLGAVAFVLLVFAMLAGETMRARRERALQAGAPGAKPSLLQEGFIVTSVLSLLGILLGFTFSIAVDRYDARRLLVLQEANAIQTAFLQAQLLEEPYRSRMSDQLVAFAANRIELGNAAPGPEQRTLLAASDQLLRDLWATTEGAFATIRNIDFSTAMVGSITELINLDEARKSARLAHVPLAVFFLLFFFLVITAGVLGYMQPGKGGRAATGFQLALLTLFLLLVIDIDRPTRGAVRESQGPMTRVLDMLEAWPSAPHAQR